MEISVTMPLDSDGFIRRECPSCLQQFKWHSGPANEEAEAHQEPVAAYYCPLCGQPAGPDSWWTQEQLDFAEQAAMPELGRAVEDEMKKMFKRSKHFTYKPGRGSDFDDASVPLIEPDDMQIVASPCHSYEPIKVPDPAGPLHCLVCGAQFAL